VIQVLADHGAKLDVKDSAGRSPMTFAEGIFLAIRPPVAKPEAMALLRRHEWPGNVRELAHVVEAAMIVCDGPEVLPGHLPPAFRTPPSEPASPQPAGRATLPTLEELERAHVEAALRATSGHRGQAARMLGISERSLYRKLRGYGLLS